MKNMGIIFAGAIGGLALVSMPQTAAAQPDHCPPGHAMKGWCAPGSGSAKFQGSPFRIGDRLSRDRYRILDRDLYYDRYGRRLDDRYYYAEANGERLLIEAATGAIIDLLLR